uniref:Tyrosine-protein kinase n=1 Tax=Ascaris suum TaxID=6253 RepID=F1KYH9_ASCSU
MTDHPLQTEMIAEHDAGRPTAQQLGTGPSEPQPAPFLTPGEDAPDLRYFALASSPNLQVVRNTPGEFNENPLQMTQMPTFTATDPYFSQSAGQVAQISALVIPPPPPGVGEHFFDIQTARDAKMAPSPQHELKLLIPPAVIHDAPVMESYENEEYYHGHLPDQDVNELLVQPGDFLLRVTDDENKGSKIILSIQWNGAVHHVPIQECGGNGFCIESATPFASMCQLIDYYTTNAIEYNHEQITLTNPILRQAWELRHNQVDLLKKIGEGAFGEVHLGRFSATSSFRVYVAIKLLKVSNQNRKQREEMMTEARMMRDFRHPNIVRFYGYAIDHEPLLIVMEHVQEGALDTYLRKKGATIPVEVRMNMCCDAATGIEYLHAIPVMHRDISARNCLYSGRMLKLSDFGLSKKGIRYQMVSTEKTPIRWTAPEVFATGVYTPKADVWAFGILMWEIFYNAQEEPYRGWNNERIRAEVRHGYRLRLPDVAPTKAKDVFAQMMVGNPDTRPAIATIANELRSAIGRMSTPATTNALQPAALKTTPTGVDAAKATTPIEVGLVPQVDAMQKVNAQRPNPQLCFGRNNQSSPLASQPTSAGKPQRETSQKRQRSQGGPQDMRLRKPTSHESMSSKKKHKTFGLKYGSSQSLEKLKKKTKNKKCERSAEKK